MQLTTSWKEEGRREGRREGVQEGRLAAGREIVMRLLKRRWGRISPALRAEVQRLSIERLERLAEALLDFSSPADLESWLARP